MLKNNLILCLFILTITNFHSANAHHELADRDIVSEKKIISHIVLAVMGWIWRGNLTGGSKKQMVVFQHPLMMRQDIHGIMILKCYLIIPNMAVKKH